MSMVILQSDLVSLATRISTVGSPNWRQPMTESPCMLDLPLQREIPLKLYMV